MQSTSTDAGTYTLTVTFEIGTDLDFAQVLVQNRVSAALASLPESVQAQGVVTQKKSTSILQIMSLTSPDGRYDSLYMSNYATINLINELARLPGVGNTQVLGVGQYSMRVWLDPQKLYTFGLTPSDGRPRHPGAEPAGDGGPGRHRRRRPRARISSTRSTSRAGSARPRSSATSSSRPSRAAAAASCA